MTIVISFQFFFASSLLLCINDWNFSWSTFNDLFFKKLDEIDDIIDQVNEYIDKDLPVDISVANRSDLEGNPEIRSSMSSGLWKMLPQSVKKLRVISIGDIDVCPCAGTHVRSLKEIGKVEFVKKDNKGAGKQRIAYKLS